MLYRDTIANTDDMYLVSHITKHSIAYIIANQQQSIASTHAQQFKRLQQRLQQGEPLAYITNQQEFYGLSFFINKHVLIPRPATESLIDHIINIQQPTDILDLGTGSGCIAITLKEKLPHTNITASDICPKALNIAKDNAQRHNTTITFVHSNWFNNIDQQFDIIVCNPPYVLQHERQQPDYLEFEPAIALFPPNDSLNIYHHIATQAIQYLKPQGTLILEIGSRQANHITTMLHRLSYSDITTHKDLTSHDRFITATLRPTAQ